MKTKVDRTKPYACSQCGVVKDPSEFPENRPACCKECRRNKKRASTERRIGRSIKPIKQWQGDYRECSMCGILKHKNKFPTAPNYEKGGRRYNARCRECVNKVQAESRSDPERSSSIKKSQKKHYDEGGGKEHVNEWRLQRTYGISVEDKERMIRENKGLCPICGSSNPGRYWVVDHCHRTQKVRGVICDFCNKALGLFRDSVSSLQGAIWYLLSSHQPTKAVCVEGVPPPEEELEWENE